MKVGYGSKHDKLSGLRVLLDDFLNWLGSRGIKFKQRFLWNQGIAM